MNNIVNIAAAALTYDFDGMAVVEAETGKIQSDTDKNIFSEHVPGSFERIYYDGQLESFIESCGIAADFNGYALYPAACHW